MTSVIFALEIVKMDVLSPLLSKGLQLRVLQPGTGLGEQPGAHLRSARRPGSRGCFPFLLLSARILEGKTKKKK